LIVEAGHPEIVSGEPAGVFVFALPFDEAFIPAQPLVHPLKAALKPN